MVVSRSMLSYAAICGARAGEVSTTTNIAAVQAVVAAAAPMLTLSSVTVTVNGLSTAAAFTGRSSGSVVSVTAASTFTPVLPIMTRLATKNFQATSAVTIP